MTNMLQNRILDERLKENGFVTIPFLNEAETIELRDFFYKNHSDINEGIYATAHASDIGFRLSMNNEIKRVFERAVLGTFENFNALGGSFIAKGKGSRGTLHPHQDWNLVNEDLFRSFNIWVPLVDLNDRNGAIQVLPKSHAWLKTYRSLNIPSVFEPVNDLLWERMETLYLKAGEALIYDHRLLHASGENKTDELRLAAVFGIIPSEAKMYYYHKIDENTVEEFESSPDFFLFGNTFDGPKGLKSIRRFSHCFDHDPKKLAALVQGQTIMQESQNVNWLTKLKLFIFSKQ